MLSKNNFTDVMKAFDLDPALRIEEHKKGHINDTFYCFSEESGSEPQYVLQAINSSIFQDVPGVMNNVAITLSHIKNSIKHSNFAGVDKVAELIKTKDGEYFATDSNGVHWRVYTYISNTYGKNVCTSVDDAYEAAFIAGRFQSYVMDLDPKQFVESIPNFHNSFLRYKSLEQAIEVADQNLLDKAKAEISYLLEKRERALMIHDALKASRVPLRLIHSDLKFNNVLFCKDTKKAVSLVDYDTYMSNSILYDFGDLVRSAASTADEDETDLSKVSIDCEYFQALAEGYLKPLSKALTKTEIELLGSAPLAISLTLAARFLTDYLSGDVYFKIDYKEHNLVRAINQVVLSKSIESNLSEMNRIISSLV